MMQRFGHTRTSFGADHALLTPDTFVRAPLPGMKQATAIVHTAPAMGAGFTQYTAELEAGGYLGPVEGQRFLYVLKGSVSIEAAAQSQEVVKNGYAFLPQGLTARVVASSATRLATIERPYKSIEGVRCPGVLVGDETAVGGQALGGDEAVQVKMLLPDDVAFDFAVNTMTYQPGASLPAVEAHVMEHGLLMLEGGGIYRLGECWYSVAAGDFIWMGPYCPQWFGALGTTPAKYLIYKDWNRHPLA